MDVTDTNGFYEWLRNRETARKSEQPQLQIELELPLAPRPRPEPEPEDVRGVCIIDLY